MKIPNVLVDDGYTETLCIQPKYAKQLGISRRRDSHPLRLADGTITQEYAYAIGSKVSDVAVCKIEFESVLKGKKRKHETAECVLREVYEDKEDNIIGAKALANLGVLVECGKSLRKSTRQKV